MKYIWRSLVIVFCVVIVIGIAIMSRLLPEGRSGWFIERGSMQQVQENTFELSEVSAIQIDYHAEEVEIYSSESAELSIKEYMNYEPSEKELSTLWRTGSTLTIEEGDSDDIFFSGIGKHKRIEIYIPKDYHDALSLNLGSGRLTMEEDMSLTEFDVDVKSGTAILGRVDAETADIHLISGKIVIDELSGRQDVDVSSGSVELRLTTGDGRYHCSSGSIDLKVSEIMGDMDLDVSSGGIKADLPEDAEFLYESDVSSGSAHTYFDTEKVGGGRREASVGNDPSKQIKVKVSSGSVNLDRY